MIATLREIWIFFRRDLSIARTYRIAFLFEAVEALFGVAMFYYVARFVDSPQLRARAPAKRKLLRLFLDRLRLSRLSQRRHGFIRPQPDGSARHRHSRASARHADFSSCHSRRLRNLSVRGFNGSHRRLRRMGRRALRLSASRSKLGRCDSRPYRHTPRFFRAGHSLRQLSSSFQARQSREMVFPRHFQPRGRHAFPRQCPSGLATVRRAVESRHVRA